jgi:hypothetical protein
MLVQLGFIRFFFGNFRFNQNVKFRFNREFIESSLLNTGSTEIRAVSTRIRAGSTGICAITQNQLDLICGGYKNLPSPLLNPKVLKPTPHDGCSPPFQRTSTPFSRPKSFPLRSVGRFFGVR